MLKYVKEIIIVVLQLLMFYVFPIFAGPTDTMGMVFLIILSVFVLSFLIGLISKMKIKILYPVIVSIMFIPSVNIHYNESALIHTVWYFVISTLSLIIGMLLRKFIKDKFKKENK